MTIDPNMFTPGFRAYLAQHPGEEVTLSVRAGMVVDEYGIPIGMAPDETRTFRISDDGTTIVPTWQGEPS